MTAVPTVDEILADPAASSWLKDAVRSALQRDALDAACDAELLAAVLGRHAVECQQRLEATSPGAAATTATTEPVASPPFPGNVLVLRPRPGKPG